MRSRLVPLAILLLSQTVFAQTSAKTAKALAATSDTSKPSAVGSAITLPPEKARPVRPPLLQKPPVIDGVFDEAEWQSASVLKDFYQILPGDNLAPSQQTEVYLAYDSKFLYVAFRAHADPAKV